LELDSLDTLEIVVLLEEQFGVTISDDDRAAFGSINRLVDFTVAELGEIPGLNEDGEDGEDGANAANAEAKADDVRMGVAA
jgi:hypothetical protein